MKTKRKRQKVRERLLNARKNARLTQQQIADMVGTERTSYTHIERGDYCPSLPIALEIAKILGGTVEDFFPLSEIVQEDETDQEHRKKRVKAQTIKFVLRIDRDVFEMLEEVAKEFNLSKTRTINATLRSYLPVWFE